MNEREQDSAEKIERSDLECVLYRLDDFNKLNKSFAAGTAISIGELIERVLRADPKSPVKQVVEALSDKEPEPNYEGEDPRFSIEIIRKYIYPWLIKKEFTNWWKKSVYLHDQSEIAIVKRSEKFPYFLMVDMTSGKLIAIETWELSLAEEEPPEVFAKTHSEWLAERKAEAKAATEKALSELPFEELDLKDVNLSKAADSGNRKHYPEKTANFVRRMMDADLAVEYLLIDQMDSITAVNYAIHRMDRRIGREATRSILSELRVGLSEHKGFFMEMTDEMKYAERIGEILVKPVSVADIENAFRLLFKCEAIYLDAIIEFPWNENGPEPFDTLINVYWFRYDFRDMKGSWEWRVQEQDMGEFKKELYKKAQIERILTWAGITTGIWFEHLKDLEEAGITYNMSDVAKVAGPLHQYFRKDLVKRRLSYNAIKSRPSGLTKLLWKTLKWAQPSRWEANRTIHFSDFRNVDSDLWDEKFPDPGWLEISDGFGRLLLSGETLGSPLGHLKAEAKTKTLQSQKEAVFWAESQGSELNDDDVDSLKKVRQRYPKSFQSEVKRFEEVVHKLSWRQLVDKIEGLTQIERIIVWHRLGYSSSGEVARLNYLKTHYPQGVDENRPVSFVIQVLFSSNAGRYYRALGRVAEKLSS